MIQELPESAGSVLGVKVSGTVTLEMEEEWINRVDERIKQHGKISILVLLENFSSWDIRAGMEDFKWLMTHLKRINKIAIVSDNHFWKWYVGMDRPFAKLVGIGEQYFQPEDIGKAWQWLGE